MVPLTSSQKFALHICHCLYHVFPIAGVKEELATLGVRDELNKVGIATNRQEKIKFIYTEHSSQISKRHWRVVFELERV
jgi:hypothetical protein